jgi:dihydroorotase
MVQAAMELDTEAFEAAGALDKLDNFASRFGVEFCGLPRNTQTVTLSKTNWTPPAEYAFGTDTVVA